MTEMIVRDPVCLACGSRNYVDTPDYHGRAEYSHAPDIRIPRKKEIEYRLIQAMGDQRIPFELEYLLPEAENCFHRGDLDEADHLLNRLGH